MHWVECYLSICRTVQLHCNSCTVVVVAVYSSQEDIPNFTLLKGYPGYTFFLLLITYLSNLTHEPESRHHPNLKSTMLGMILQTHSDTHTHFKCHWMIDLINKILILIYIYITNSNTNSRSLRATTININCSFITIVLLILSLCNFFLSAFLHRRGRLDLLDLSLKVPGGT